METGTVRLAATIAGRSSAVRGNRRTLGTCDRGHSRAVRRRPLTSRPIELEAGDQGSPGRDAVQRRARSLHLAGSYDQAPFDVAVELSHDLKLALNPPLTTTGSGDQNVTVSIDFSACFVNAGVPVDPRTLASGGSAARNSFRDCVASHLRAFDDRNRDGQETGDDHGNDGHGSDG